MKGSESGKEKVKKICDILRKETLEPALQERDEIIQRAHLEAEKILQDARERAKDFLIEAGAEVERGKAIYQASLNQASKQAVQLLRQIIEEKLFNHELSQLFLKPLQNPQVIADLITVVVKAIEKEGKEVDLSVFIPGTIPAHEINVLLSKEILAKLKEKSVLVSTIGGGIEVKLRNENITLDLSNTALNELIGNYIRKDFRETFFGAV